MKHEEIMLDLETMGVSRDAPIVQIGAIAFSRSAPNETVVYYQEINLESAMAHGALPEAHTIIWWFEQDADARARMLHAMKNGVGLPMALVGFSQWVDNNTVDDRKVWGNSPAMDCVALRGAYSRCGMEAPWKFYNERDYRTLRAEAPEVERLRKADHNALGDADAQLEHLRLLLKHFSLRR